MASKVEECADKLGYYIDNDELGCGHDLVVELMALVREEERKRVKDWLNNMDNPALERVIAPMQAYYRLLVDVDDLIDFIDTSPASKEKE